MKGGDAVKKVRPQVSSAHGRTRAGARSRRRGRMLAQAAAAAAVTVFFVSTAAAVSVRPDLIERLRAEGRLSEYVKTQVPVEKDAAERGLNAPSRPRGLDDGVFPLSQAQPRNLRVVVVLTDFDDNPADTVNYPPSYFEDFLFSRGTRPGGSFRDYYLENSYGTLDVTGVVTRWIRMPEPYSYYVGGKRGFGYYPANAQGLAEAAARAADYEVNYSNFDNDGPDGVPDSGDDDGFVDALFVVHAGPGYETTLDTNDIHSHKWALFYELTLDGVKLFTYAMEPENGLLGVYCHEFGHCLGLIDLYDRDLSSMGLGGWSLMATGSWNQLGLKPGHLDAWSRVKAGFVTPTVLSGNAADVLFPPIEEEPVACRLRENGTAGTEYFLVERREKIGFDESLPGGGLLIYHVDESQSNNDDAYHYKVGLEQADGNWQLENRINGGDAGDPYPGTSGNTTFGYETVPSSMTYAGGDSRVRVFDVEETGDGIYADMWVTQAPILSVVSYSVADEDGNYDGNPDPGETVTVGVVLRNDGSYAADVTCLLIPSSSCINMLDFSTSFGPMEPGALRASPTPFSFMVADTLTQDPFAAWFDVTIFCSSGYSTRDSTLIGVGDRIGLEDDMETAVGWRHYPVRGGWHDEWHLTSRKQYEGVSSWGCLREDYSSYSSKHDGALETPVVLIGKEGRLVFYHWIDAQVDSDWAYDGGFVEVSVNGSDWTQIMPIDGYDCLLKAQREPTIESRWVYSGTSEDWERVEFSLAQFENCAVNLRFRFVSNADYIEGEGWFIDSLSVVSSGTPVLIGSLRAQEADGCVTLRWFADADLRNAPFSVWRDPGPDGAPGMHVVSDEPVLSVEDYEFTDCDVRPGERYAYWVGVDGAPGLMYGPVAVDVAFAGAGAPRMELASPNPVTGVLRLLLQTPAGVDMDGISLRVFDATGRCVTTLTPRFEKGDGGQSVLVEWTPSDYSGKTLSSGVYFLKLDWPGGSDVEKVVVLRDSGSF
ncbi:MAG: M6 family metalloprotease domain-containing protein [Candidatus Eisenbacteria bacterium]|nr:M6 family metalloprotease domain-containing protein [Candidatus Eisenbacteria bacterium]